MADTSYQTQADTMNNNDDNDVDETFVSTSKAAFSLEAKSNSGSVEVGTRSV